MRRLRKVKDTKEVNVHTQKSEPRPVSLEEYRAGQKRIAQQLDYILCVLEGMCQGVENVC